MAVRLNRLFSRRDQYEPGSSLSAKSWQRLRKNKLSMGSLGFILFALTLGVLGYLVVPDKSPYANEQHLELAIEKPGFTVEMLKVRKNEPSHRINLFNLMVNGRRSDFRYVPYDSVFIREDEMVVLPYSGDESFKGPEITFLLADILYPLPYEGKRYRVIGDSAYFTDLEGRSHQLHIEKMQEVIREKNLSLRTYWLGTDRFGRDMLSRIILGIRVSLSVGFISVFISLVVGITIGSAGGFFRGRIDQFVVWLINVVWSIPTLLLVIAITFALGKGFWQVFVAVGLTTWVEVARISRGQIMSIREKEFVEAGRALGYSSIRIIRRHVLPNIMGPIIVISAANFATAILLEAGLSFLGIGVQPPTPSWGMMIKENYPYIILDAAYLAILPGLAIMLMVLAFMLLGNGLRDALDVRVTKK